MMKGGLNRCLWAVIFLAVLLAGAIDQKSQNVLKIEKLLTQIEKHPSRTGRGDRKAEVTERELNDYIGYRLAREKPRIINSLDVRLLNDNHVQGKIVLDARRLNCDMFFGKTLDFDFKGIVHSRRGAARLDLNTLHLNGRPVSPQTLDMVLGAIALANGTETARIDDWYALPKGLKRIAVRKGMAELRY
jgi:hypothetical protein